MAKKQLDLDAMMLDPVKFREELMIETASGPVRLAEAMKRDPWQDVDFRNVDGGLMRAIGIPVTDNRPIYSRAWLQRHRGGSKTQDIGTHVCYGLYAAPRAVEIVVAAGSKDQAGFVLDSTKRNIKANKWLSCFDMQSNVIINPKNHARCQVISSEASTSWGLLVDVVIAEELCHWPAAGEELFHSLLSAVAKKPHAAFLTISNAGHHGSFQEEIYKQVQAEGSGWYFSSLEGFASWISPEVLEEQRRMLPPSVFDRVWRSIWSSGIDSAISDTDLRNAVVLKGRVSGDEAWRRANRAWGGLDIGVKRDRSGFVVLGVPNEGQVIRLVHCESWKPPRGGEVDLQAVENAVLAAHRAYGLQAVLFDPSQALHSAQRLRRRGVNMVETPFVARALDDMARSLMMTFRNGQVELYEHAELIKDLRSLKIVERMQGLRLSAVSGPSGHADLGIAFSLSIVPAEAAANARCKLPGDKALPMQVVTDHSRHGVQFSRGIVAKGREGWTNRNFDFGIPRFSKGER